MSIVPPVAIVSGQEAPMQGFPSPSAISGASRSALLARADTICRDQEVRFTRLRRRVLEVLLEADGPLGAYDLAALVSEPERKVAPISIYRVLDVLTALELVQRIVLRNAYVAREVMHAPGAAIVFLVCRCCGRVGETVSSEVEHGLDRALTSTGFRPLDRVLEIEGECAACQIGDHTIVAATSNQRS